jgi:hypothetical protein
MANNMVPLEYEFEQNVAHVNKHVGVKVKEKNPHHVSERCQCVCSDLVVVICRLFARTASRSIWTCRSKSKTKANNKATKRLRCFNVALSFVSFN